jgi:putative proteasome-type protease
MTYCLAVTLESGLVFASDSRTHGGTDYVRTHSKMHTFPTRSDRFFVLLSAGNLATTQAVVNRVQRDLDDPDAPMSLNAARYRITRHCGKHHGLKRLFRELSAPDWD